VLTGATGCIGGHLLTALDAAGSLPAALEGMDAHREWGEETERLQAARKTGAVVPPGLRRAQG
jgi:nucleoside-diphosphate-sugar epimerase